MAGPGQIPGRYNIVVNGAYATFEHQIPIEEFIQRLENDKIPDEVSVEGLGEALQDGDLAGELARENESTGELP